MLMLLEGLRHSGASRLQLTQWKLQHGLTQLARNRAGNGEKLTALKNRLPNGGGVPLDTAEYDPQRIISSIFDRKKRATKAAGFEGLALDDALAYTNEYKHFSFFRLARTIAQIARRIKPSGNRSVLELGCGGGDMRPFLETQGISNYVGVDGNPAALLYSPHVKGHETQFHLLNLQQEIDFGHQFDVVCTFEVLEHICEENLDNIIGTIRRHMGAKSVFLGTASLQNDIDVHVTVRERPFWLNKFRQHGLVPHPSHQQFETRLSRNHPFNWHAGNTNVFALQLEKHGNE
jgi:SAM-dependent methyltransferase